MALQTSGAIDLLDIQNEFGGSSPISISEYVGEVGKSASSGANVQFSDFYGASASEIINVTIGRYYLPGGKYTSEEEVYGFDNIFWNIGSVSPGTYGGFAIRTLVYITNEDTYVFRLGSGTTTLGSGFFSSIAYEGAHTLYTSNADFTNNDTYSTWKWTGYISSAWTGYEGLTKTATIE